MKSVYMLLLFVACIYARAVEEFDEDITDIAERPGGDDDPDSEVDHWHHRTTPKIAFSTYLSKDYTRLGHGQHIKFDRVLLNDGNGYNAAVGTFCARYSGVYSFTYVIAQLHMYEVRVNLVVDGRIINGAIAEGKHNYQDVQGTNTAIIRVHSGQHVWIQAHSGRRIQGDTTYYRYSTFSGFLLYK